jgi:hypothetical protein
MELKEVIKETFWDNKKITLERYLAAKKIFILVSFLFFLDFYFVGAWFYPNIFSSILGYLYILLLISILFYFYFWIKRLLINIGNRTLNIIIFIILLIILVCFALPVIIHWWIETILNLFWLFIK